MKKNVWLGVFVILVLQAACSYANQQVETFAQFEQEPDSIERVITLRGTLSHGSYTPITITQPGVYRLAGAMSVTGDLAAIRIAANNVFLDLDGNTVTVAGNAGGIFIDGQDVKVINGTIAGSGSTGCGVQVQGNNCRLEHIDVVSTATGFECIHAGSNMLLDCRALQSSAAGFSFVSSGTNTVSRCQALNLAGSNSVYGFLIADGQANVFDSCVVSDAKTSALTSTAQVGGFVFQGASSFNKLSNGKVTNVSTSNSAVACYGIFCDLVLSTSNSITNNRVNGVTNTATGVGISIDSSKNYVAQNTSCNNDINFENIAPSYITSQANARGVYNINCSSDVPDTVELINSTIDTTVVPELWSIESKAEVISSKIDRLSNDTEELWSIESKAEVISSKIDTVPGAIAPELWSIESKAEVISSKIDTIPGQLTPELWSIESKAEVISSKIDRLSNDTPELWSIESKAEVISSKIDRLSNGTEELWSIESKAEVISSKIDTVPGQLTPELWSIESKAEVISSKIDALPRDAAELWSIESKSEVISSKIDTVPGAITPELWSIESKAEVISSKIDTVPGKLTPELWSIESKSEVISSKIDKVVPAITPELWSIESKAEIISSKIDRVVPAITPELWSIESKVEVISSKLECSSTAITSVPYSITQSGAYCIASTLGVAPGSTAITISTNNVWIDFNGQALQGNIVISGGLTNIRLTNGALAGGITCSGDVTSLTMRDFGITDASNEAIRIDGIARKFVVQDCIFTDYGTTGIYINTANMLELRNSLFSDNNYSGTGLVVIQGRNVDVRECNFKQNNYGIYLGTSATGSQLKGVQIEGCLITSSSLVGISLNNCASVDIDDCEITRQIDNYKGGSGVLINGGNTIEVNDSTISQFYYGIAVRGTATAPVAAFTIRDCRVNYNMRGILCSTNTVGSVTGCILEYNGRSQAAGCGFQDLTGLNSQVWYLSNLAMGNGSSPAKQTTPFDSNYTSGYDVPANPLGMTPVLSYASAGNSTAPYYQLIKVAGGGGGSDAPAGKRGAIAHWDNVSGAFSTIDAPV